MNYHFAPLIMLCRLALMLVPSGLTVHAQEPLPVGPDAAAAAAADVGAEAVQLSVDRAVEWLAARQISQTGAFADRPPAAMTGLACLALMAAGEQDGRTTHGEKLRRAILYLVGQVESGNGYVGGDGGRMYGQGIVTLALSEAYGMLRGEDANLAVRNALFKCRDLIIGSQITTKGVHEGGWRYLPGSKDADLSVTSWQILALKSMRDAGIQVPDVTLQRARRYVRSCYVPGQGFAYQPGGQVTPAMRAAGIVCMIVLGGIDNYEDMTRIEVAAGLLTTANQDVGQYYYYQGYYRAVATELLAATKHEEFPTSLERTLMQQQQQPSGEFAKHSGYAGGVYATAMAVLCLTARDQYLPVYQKAED